MKGDPRMVKRRPPKQHAPSDLEKARDELYSHILRCGVLQAQPDDQKEWFDDTIEYMAERYPSLTNAEIRDLRELGERYCQPVIQRGPAVGATN
jgi:hypothetical protein